MEISNLIKHLALGPFVGCFICLLVASLVALQTDPQIFTFKGQEIINLFLGGIVIGWGFSLSGLIYEKEDIALPLQILFQMIIGMSVLFLTAIYLKWMPTDLGIWPIITWISIACIFSVIFWLGFYIYYYLLARDLNKKIVSK